MARCAETQHATRDIGSGANEARYSLSVIFLLVEMTPTIGKEFGSERDVPTWNGIEEGWNGYIEEVEWYFWATAPKDRHLVASRLARRLTGSARNAIRGLRPREFAGTQGITRLLRILQSRIGDLPISDLANKLDY